METYLPKEDAKVIKETSSTKRELNKESRLEKEISEDEASEESEEETYSEEDYTESEGTYTQNSEGK